MSFTLKDIVPWGRSLAEYVAMFALTEVDLRGTILGCGDGPAAFNASLTRQGGHVVSVDPVYRFSAEEIRRRIDETFVDVMEQTRKNRQEFVWATIQSVEELGQVRMAAMEEFLADYPQGAERGGYVDGELPNLPFADRAFDLAVRSQQCWMLLIFVVSMVGVVLFFDGRCFLTAMAGLVVAYGVAAYAIGNITKRQDALVELVEALIADSDRRDGGAVEQTV